MNIKLIQNKKKRTICLSHTVLFLLIVFFSCSNLYNDIDNPKKIIDNLLKSNCKTQLDYHSDSIIDFTISKKFSNGNIKCSFGFSNDSLFGPFNLFYRNGNWKANGVWNMNKLYGQYFESYNFPSDTITNIVQNRTYVRSILPRKIKKYSFYNSKGELIYSIKYKKNGKIIKKTKFNLIEVQRESWNATVNKPYFVHFYYPDPPHSKTILQVYKYNLEGQKKLIEYKKTDYAGEFQIKPIFNHSGKGYIKLIAYLIINGEPIESDTSIIHINVVP